MQLVTPRVVAIAVAIDTMSWIISFQVFLFVDVLIVKKFLFENFLEEMGERYVLPLVLEGSGEKVEM